MIDQIPHRPINDAEVWHADSGSTHHKTGDLTHVFDTRAPPSDSNSVVLGNGKVMPVLAVGSLKVRFYQSSRDGPDSNGTCILLTNAYVLEGIRFNFIFDPSGSKEPTFVLSGNDGVHLFDGRLRFDRHERSSSQFASRLPPDYGSTPFVIPVVVPDNDPDSASSSENASDTSHSGAKSVIPPRRAYSPGPALQPPRVDPPDSASSSPPLSVSTNPPDQVLSTTGLSVQRSPLQDFPPRFPSEDLSGGYSKTLALASNHDPSRTDTHNAKWTSARCFVKRSTDRRRLTHGGGDATFFPPPTTPRDTHNQRARSNPHDHHISSGHHGQHHCSDIQHFNNRPRYTNEGLQWRAHGVTVKGWEQEKGTSRVGCPPTQHAAPRKTEERSTGQGGVEGMQVRAQGVIAKGWEPEKGMSRVCCPPI